MATSLLKLFHTRVNQDPFFVIQRQTETLSLPSLADLQPKLQGIRPYIRKSQRLVGACANHEVCHVGTKLFVEKTKPSVGCYFFGFGPFRASLVVGVNLWKPNLFFGLVHCDLANFWQNCSNCTMPFFGQIGL